MHLNVSTEYSDDLDRLLADSALAAIDPEAPWIQIETALRSLRATIAKADPLRRAMVREAAIRRLRTAGVQSPATLADTAFGPVEPPCLHTAIELRGPVPWEETIDGPALLDEIADTLRRFVVLPAGAADAQALWCLNTYAHEASGVSPILCIRSPEKRSGKTRNLEVLSCLVHRPVHTANITVAALYRTIDHYRPTMLIDEADTIFLNGSNAELRGLLNAGLYRSNAFVLRCIGRDQEPKLSSVWCPKAIALIGRLPSTLEDRSIVTSLRRRTADEAVEPFHYDQVLEEMESIRRKSARWAADHLAPLKSANPEVSDALNDRARDLWRPLQAIADAVGGGWPERARQTAGALSSDTPEPDPPAIPHQVRPVVLKHETQQEVTHVKTKETITTATKAPQTRTPRRAPVHKKTAKSTPQKISNADPEKPGAKRQTVSARKIKAAPPLAGSEQARTDTKKAIVLELLQRKQGAAMSEIGKATGWQNHTIRGFISGTVTKKMGLAVDSSQNEAGVRIYRIIR